MKTPADLDRVAKERSMPVTETGLILLAEPIRASARSRSCRAACSA